MPRNYLTQKFNRALKRNLGKKKNKKNKNRNDEKNYRNIYICRILREDPNVFLDDTLKICNSFLRDHAILLPREMYETRQKACNKYSWHITSKITSYIILYYLCRYGASYVCESYLRRTFYFVSKKSCQQNETKNIARMRDFSTPQ